MFVYVICFQHLQERATMTIKVYLKTLIHFKLKSIIPQHIVVVRISILQV